MNPPATTKQKARSSRSHDTPMAEYRLQALLKIREHKKQHAERQLQNAIAAHHAETQKLALIETRLRDTMVLRTERQHNFFHRSLVSPSTKTEVICHIASHHKTMIDEIDLRKMLAEQKELVHSASRTVEVATTVVVDAERNLKVIEKHYSAWLRALHRAKEIKEEYANDDQNGVRFLLRKA